MKSTLKQKIIIINRKDFSMHNSKTESSATHITNTATIIVPINNLNLSQQSNAKLHKLLTKLLLNPKKLLVDFELENLIGKDGSILDISLQRNFSLMQINRKYIWPVSDYHYTQSSHTGDITENKILDFYMTDFNTKFPKDVKSRNYFDALLFEYIIHTPLP